MKIRISVAEEKLDYVENYLKDHGIEVSNDGEYVLSESTLDSDFIEVRNKEKDRLNVKTEDIIFIEAFGKEIEIHTEKETYYAKDRMYELESELDSKEFLRISKSVIISKKHVRRIRPSLSMKYVLTLTGGTLVDVTRNYYNDFRRFFGI
ncbi:MAG: LytTR family transcriptional regulator [Lachnospiraceae bacterium]|nr:LytTR family transcriptional regulator [Lachnospiraceae bacterium]